VRRAEVRNLGTPVIEPLRVVVRFTVLLSSMLIGRSLMVGVDIRALLLDVRFAGRASRKLAAATASAALIAYQPSMTPRLTASRP
jgi:hypothetical protein